MKKFNIVLGLVSVVLMTLSSMYAYGDIVYKKPVEIELKSLQQNHQANTESTRPFKLSDHSANKPKIAQ